MDPLPRMNEAMNNYRPYVGVNCSRLTPLYTQSGRPKLKKLNEDDYTGELKERPEPQGLGPLCQWEGID